ncbi:ATP-dependent zinc protease family protein [Arcticibacterium luteifluviistationis]|uniref:Peptidase n=1 Tax=Arcticibacterium luteifluviistationis TaxID=1784714 RepID=A0A2Z4GFW7_9BACT|nr:RimK/LysX family protein [Arcticibacterium luteifluviistationis]AWV99673.1 peptidase [Arcticibacterium luteifluviistationis]
MKIIGRKERADLPALALFNIEVKVDTGAYTSSLHCESIIEIDGGISCQFLNLMNANSSVESIVFTDFGKRKVKSSNGIEEERYSIWTKICLGEDIFDIELTLTNRSEMRTPLLLGRKFIRKKYLVDVAKKEILKK